MIEMNKTARAAFENACMYHENMNDAVFKELVEIKLKVFGKGETLENMSEESAWEINRIFSSFSTESLREWLVGALLGQASHSENRFMKAVSY